MSNRIEGGNNEETPLTVTPTDSRSQLGASSSSSSSGNSSNNAITSTGHNDSRVDEPRKTRKVNYETFQQSNIKHPVSGISISQRQRQYSPFALFPRCLFASLCMRRFVSSESNPTDTLLDPTRKVPPQQQQNEGSSGDVALAMSRRIVILISIVVAILACLRKRPINIIPGIPEWHWDHNVYISTTTTTTQQQQQSSNGGNNNDNDVEEIVLVAQVVSSRPLRQLSDISSKPNRAYARQFGMDYAQYDSGRPSYSSQGCFDKIFVLNTILDRQSLEKTNESNSLLWSPHPSPERVRYSSIILLNPDSIVTNLDTNLFEAMLPSKDRLVAIAGFDDDTNKLNSRSGIIIYNLRHKYAYEVAKLWSALASAPATSCGNDNDLGMLLTAIGTVMDPKKESFDDLIHGVKETTDGFVGDRMVKCIPPSVPGPRLELLIESLEESRTDLQKTADAVCYRYYPRCEVIVT